MQNSTNTPFKYTHNRERKTFGEKKTFEADLGFFHKRDTFPIEQMKYNVTS